MRCVGFNRSKQSWGLAKSNRDFKPGNVNVHSSNSVIPSTTLALFFLIPKEAKGCALHITRGTGSNQTRNNKIIRVQLRACFEREFLLLVINGYSSVIRLTALSCLVVWALKIFTEERGFCVFYFLWVVQCLGELVCFRKVLPTVVCGISKNPISRKKIFYEAGYRERKVFKFDHIKYDPEVFTLHRHRVQNFNFKFWARGLGGFRMDSISQQDVILSFFSNIYAHSKKKMKKNFIQNIVVSHQRTLKELSEHTQVRTVKNLHVLYIWLFWSVRLNFTWLFLKAGPMQAWCIWFRSLKLGY